MRYSASPGSNFHSVHTSGGTAVRSTGSSTCPCPLGRVLGSSTVDGLHEPATGSFPGEQRQSAITGKRQKMRVARLIVMMNAFAPLGFHPRSLPRQRHHDGGSRSARLPAADHVRRPTARPLSVARLDRRRQPQRGQWTTRKWMKYSLSWRCAVEWDQALRLLEFSQDSDE
jgi:hypothetical protein